MRFFSLLREKALSGKTNVFMLLSFFPFSDRMIEMEKREDFSVSGDNNVPSTSTNVDSDANASTRQKRNPKQCKKCGRSVINLSRHQKDVHGMTKMRRKLDGYFTGDKKTPNRQVKFCPLSPCKNLKMPIFQLHKHLQTSIHKLTKPKETEDNTVGACEEGLSRGETMNCNAEDNT